MSTALSMPSPHGAFASSLQLSPAFRSLHTAALRQRQAEFERLRELARSDEFSDDESDGDEDEDEAEEEDEDDGNQDIGDADDATEEAAHARREHEVPSPRDIASDSDIDTDETVLLPFIRPTVSNSRSSRAPHEALSPKADDWTIVDKSPTCESLVFGKSTVSESWFSRS